MVGKLDEADALLRNPYPSVRAMEGIDAESSRHGQLVADLLLHNLERLHPEAGPIGERAAVLVGAGVVHVHEELHRNGADLGAMYVHYVEACASRPLGSFQVELLDLTDIPLGHRSHRTEVRGLLDPAVNMTSRNTAVDVCRERPACVKFNARERAMLMDLVGHPCPIGYIVLVPNPGRRHLPGPVELGRDRCCLGIDDGPASLGFDPSMVGLAAGKHVAESSALWSLIEAVAHRLRADHDRFK